VKNTELGRSLIREHIHIVAGNPDR
jgi:hypothetical protein